MCSCPTLTVTRSPNIPTGLHLIMLIKKDRAAAAAKKYNVNAYYDYDDYPVREVFSPETSVKREVFSPRADIQVTDVDTDQLPIEAPETKDNE